MKGDWPGCRRRVLLTFPLLDLCWLPDLEESFRFLCYSARLVVFESHPVRIDKESEWM